MDLSVPAIFSATLKGIRENLYIYLLLLLWLLIGGIILFVVLTLGSLVLITTLISTEPSAQSGLNAIAITAVMFAFISFVTTLLSAGSRAGILAIAARVRKGEKAGPLDFFKGIIRYTWRLFIGGILIGMLTAIPVLAFLLYARYSLTPGFGEIFTSGWNYQRSFEVIRYFYNGIFLAGAAQAIIFFWIALWDEMVVFYDIPIADALQKSFTFVFSKRHFLRVLGVILVNMLIANLVIIITNIGIFSDTLSHGFWFSWVNVMLIAPSSSITPWIQLLFLPVFAFAQIFLLPVTQKETAATDVKENLIGGAFEVP